MSGRSAVTESGNPVDPLQTALKRVYSVHKEKLKELSDERDVYKDGCEVLLQHKTRLLEKARNLQNQNEVLCNENTRLRNLLESVTTQDGRGGRCETCDHLQRSLSAIQEAYKHSLEEKEKMIHYLEERVVELNRHSSPFSKQQDLNLSSLLTPDKSITDGDAARASRTHRKSPLLRGVEEENTTSRKILDAVTHRLGHASTQEDNVLNEDVIHRKQVKESSKSKDRDMHFDDSGYFGKGSLRNKASAVNHKAKSPERKCEYSDNLIPQEDANRAVKSDGNRTAKSDGNRTLRQDPKRQVDSDKHRGHENTEQHADRNIPIECEQREERAIPPPSEKSGRPEENADKESPETQRLRKLGLGRKPGKRSRYTEDSPTNKKAKIDKSPISTSEDSDAQAVIRNKLPGQRTHDLDSDRTVSMSSEGSPVNRRGGKDRVFDSHTSKARVLVQETCDIDSDRTVSMSSEGSPVSRRGRRDSVPDSHYPDYLVVPETLGMGVTSSESESEDNTQNTVRARSEKGSPGQVLHSPPSEEDADNELHNAGFQKEGNSRGTRKGLTSGKHVENTKGVISNDNVDSQKKRNSGGFDNNDCRPSSPVFSGGRGARPNIESPFLFDDDRPASRELDRRRSMNASCLTSDHESPLLLKPVTSTCVSKDCGQSPLLKETKSKMDKSNTRMKSIEVSGNNSDQESPLLLQPVGLKAVSKDFGQSPVLENRSTRLEAICPEVTSVPDTEYKTGSSQDRAQRLSKGRNLRTSERLKQTTLSQAFTSSPPSSPYTNLSPTKPEEREAIDRAIRLSLQEIDYNKGVVKTKKPLFGKNKGKRQDVELTENIPPLFKKPPSPPSYKSPSKRKSPNKRSPTKEKTNKSSHIKESTQTEIVLDLDETVPPDTETLQAITRQYDPDKGEITGGMLNQSIDPDISLTQYCSDTELLSQRRHTRSFRSGKSSSQNSQIHGREKDVKISKSKDMNIHQNDRNRNKTKHSTWSQNDSEMTIRSGQTSALTHFTPSDGVSLGGDVCLVSSGESKASSCVEIRNRGPTQGDVCLVSSGESKASSVVEKRSRGRNQGDVYLVSSGESKPSSSVEIRSCGASQDLQEEEEVADITLDPRFMRAHMFEGQMEESQGIPLSSCSYKFGSTKSKDGSLQDIEKDGPSLQGDISSEEENTLTMDGPRRKSFNDSFDRVPRKESVNYAHVEVVRKKADRKQLKATTCKECYDYYKSKGLSEEEIAEQIQDCSRHRARHLPPSTPEHFWSIGFADTQECLQRGYIGVESPSKRKPGYRRRRKLAMRFKSRQDEDEEDDMA